MPKCSNPQCSKDAGIAEFCSSACRIASRGSPEGHRVRRRPNPPTVPAAVLPATPKPETETHPNGDKKLPPLWQRKDLAMKTPIVLEKNLPMVELMARFQRAKDYNAYQTRIGQLHHVTTEDTWKLWLVRSGIDHKLSRHIFPALAS